MPRVGQACFTQSHSTFTHWQCGICYILCRLEDSTALICAFFSNGMLLCVMTVNIPTFWKNVASVSSCFGKCSKSNQIYGYSSRTYKLLKMKALISVITRMAMYVWRNIQARSRNHCCSGKAVLHIMSVFVACTLKSSLLFRGQQQSPKYTLWAGSRGVTLIFLSPTKLHYRFIERQYLCRIWYRVPAQHFWLQKQFLYTVVYLPTF